MREQVMQDAVNMSGVESPLAMRMIENMPGIATSIGFSTARGTNTLMRGGFMDFKYGAKRNIASKFRLMDETGALSNRSAANFFGGGRISRGQGMLGRRATRMAANPQKAGFLRSARVNNITMRPRAMGRFHSLSVFGQGGMYTPFGASGILGKTKVGAGIVKSAGIDLAAGESAFGPGLMSFVTAGRKADLLETRAAGTGRRAARAQKRLGVVDRNIRSLATMNNQGLLAPMAQYGTVRQDLTKAFRAPKGGVYIDGKFYKGGAFLPGGAAQIEGVTSASRYRVMAGKTVTFNGRTYYGSGTGTVGAKSGQFFPGAGRYVDHQMVTGYGASMLDSGLASSQRGIRGNLMASAMAGQGTRYMAGYFRGALGFAGVAGLEGKALTGAQKAVEHMSIALGEKGIAGKVGLEGAQEVLEKGVFKTLGRTGTMEALSSKAGMKVLGARAAAMAIPGLNVVATASLIYDLGRMAGEVVKSGINLAKDANKSLQGDINKPLFGMGYKDTEAAATSRSRGVMAIQNSRLNARSMLGSEGAMMAAHYG